MYIYILYVHTYILYYIYLHTHSHTHSYNLIQRFTFPVPNKNRYQLFNGDASGDLGPESSKLDRRHQLLGVSVHVGVQHEAAEGGAEVKGQRLVHHTQEDELDVQLLGDLVDGQILTVQAHAGKELQLVPEPREKKTLRLAS